MSALIYLPNYSQPNISSDESHARAIADVLDPEVKLPTHCGACGEQGSFKNPLMMEPLRRFDNGLPRGTLYVAKCSHCKERAARRR